VFIIFLFLMYTTDNIRTQSFTLNNIDDVGDIILMTCSSMLKVHKHEIILNFFFYLNQILISPS
jgi:hypothetical protein